MSLETLKKSRSAHLGVVAKEHKKYATWESYDPSKLDIDSILQKIAKLEQRKADMEDCQAKMNELVNVEELEDEDAAS